MAIIQCKECRGEVSTTASACPKCGARVAPTQYGLGSLVVALLVIAVIWAVFSPKDPPSSPSTPDANAATPALPGAQWSYFNGTDDMSQGIQQRAVVRSSNTVNFGFPYGGDQHASLTLRTHPRYGKDVLVSLAKAQFLCRSYEHCKVLVRFDDETPARFSGLSPEDGSTNVVFIGDYARFVSKMAGAKRVRISTTVYQQADPVFDFDVRGFDVKKYLAKK